MIPGTVAGVLLFALAMAAAVLVLIFVLVPLLKGVGLLIGGIFKLIGWLVAHVFEFIGGMIGDTLRFVGSIIAFVLFAPLVLLNVVVGRWSAAGHFTESAKRECKVGAACLYRVALRRPLKLLLLHGLLEGIEQRVPEAMAAAPTSDKPRKRVGQFEGYTIVGSLKGGGSGAKLYIAQPDGAMIDKYPGMPERVVIKSFALSEGSTLPQIVRESRSLECAKQLGLVFDHGMDPHRFYYVMPYHAGDHLGIVARQLHGETDGRGLEKKQLETGLGFACDLLHTLSTYHRGGLWHKDVKPENIIIHSGRANLVDLGLVTPLRSAMTLTTHGTEYFRDPELVRQALRGVKVHQINGAKFDIYAAGAVLYFMIENTFPPHGALSRFSRKSPDSVRWIVRRAMADYNHRYETADAMLADLYHVVRSQDVFQVKPADLPSMKGGAGEQLVLDRDDAYESIHHAGSPLPPSSPPAPLPPPFPAPDAGDRPRRQHAAADSTYAGSRPKLDIVNWWTGAYRLDDAGDPAQAARNAREQARVAANEAARAAQEVATDWRHQAADFRHKVQTGAMSARTAAKAQIKSARTRAKEIRQRAKKHRRLAVAERQPSGAMAAIVLIVLVLGAVFFVNVIRRSNTSSSQFTVGSGVDGAETYARIETGAASSDEADLGTPILMLPMVSDPFDPRVLDRLETIASDHREQGFDVIMSERILEDGMMRDAFSAWLERKDKETDRVLEDLLDQYNLYGILHVSDSHDSKLVRGSVIRSERKHAKDRRFPVFDAPMATLPYLLINDHPTKHDPDVSTDIEQSITSYQLRGWPVVVDPEMEAAVRAEMPAGVVDESTVMPGRLHELLAERGLGGIVYILRGEEPGEIMVRRIDATDGVSGLEGSADRGREVFPETHEDDVIGAPKPEGPDAMIPMVAPAAVPYAPAAAASIPGS